MSRRVVRGPGVLMSGFLPWPFLITCAECGLYGARAYPFPMFEDADLFEDPEELSGGATIGTIWCPRCDPPWGEALLQMMTSWTIAWRPGVHPVDPAMPLLGGAPVEAIAFLESELADFLDGPGPLARMRPHWLGDGPIAPRSEAFVWACADLVAWMRDARRIGFLSFGTPREVLA